MHAEFGKLAGSGVPSRAIAGTIYYIVVHSMYHREHVEQPGEMGPYLNWV